MERRRLELARLLPHEQFTQRLVCLRGEGQLLASLESHGTRVDQVNDPAGNLTLASILRVAAIAREFKPDIIHGAVFEGVSMAVGGGTLARVPHIIVEEIDYPIHRTGRANVLFRALASRADRCVAVSGSVTSYLRKIRVPQRKIAEIRNGVDLYHSPSAEEVERERVALGIKPGDLIFGSIGRVLDSHKRFSDLIEVASILAPEYPNLKLLIVGDGIDRQRLEQMAVDKGVGDRCIFAGYRFNVAAMYSLMDVFALASDRESFGLVLVEAMLANLPVVATNVGGPAEIVEDDVTGYLVPVGHPQQIAARLRVLLASREKRERMGSLGRERALRLFSVDRYVREVAALYRSVCPRPRVVTQHGLQSDDRPA